jgi:hypothetical protein
LGFGTAAGTATRDHRGAVCHRKSGERSIALKAPRGSTGHSPLSLPRYTSLKFFIRNSRGPKNVARMRFNFTPGENKKGYSDRRRQPHSGHPNRGILFSEGFRLWDWIKACRPPKAPSYRSAIATGIVSAYSTSKWLQALSRQKHTLRHRYYTLYPRGIQIYPLQSEYL